MGELLSPVSGAGRKNKFDFEDYFVRKVIQKNEDSDHDLMMKMVGGNVGELKELKKSSISDYLTKFSYFCRELERAKRS